MGRTASAANNRCQLDASTPGARTFEAAMAGSCQLLFTDSLEVMDYFEVGEEILLFDDTEDFRAQLESLLADRERACAIGTAAQRRAYAITRTPHGRAPCSDMPGWICRNRTWSI